MKKQTIPKELSLMITAAAIFLFFSFWWYGFFPEIGKRKEPYTPGESMKYNDYWEASYNYYDPYLDKDEKIDKKTFTELERNYIRALQKEISHLSTKALFESLRTHYSGNPVYSTPQLAYDYMSCYGEDTSAGAAYKELLSRNNTGKVILTLYLKDMRISQSLFDDLALMEIILAQPEVRSHLTVQELDLLSEAIYKKQ